MPKEVKGYDPRGPARSIKEFILLTGLTTEECIPNRVDLSQEICGIFFRYPIMPAAMSCLYNFQKYDLAIASAKNGMPPVIHCNQSIDKQVEIIRAVKDSAPREGIETIENPVVAYNYETLGDVLRRCEKHGHSIIPVVDKFRRLEGVFIRPFESLRKTDTKITDAQYYTSLENLIIAKKEKDVKHLLEKAKQRGQRFLPLLDNQGHLVALIFSQKFPGPFCGAAISTHAGWKERAKECIEAGADFVVVDTSDAYSVFAREVGQEFKEEFPNIPLVLGNIITEEAFNYLAEFTDFIKVGMMTGLACKTGAVKSVGRPLFSALYEVYYAREKYANEKGKYIPIIADGGLFRPGEWIIALAFAELMMAGAYFAQFYESAGMGLDENKKFTNSEEKIVWKEYWGEGSDRARNLERYGQELKTVVEEGVDGFVRYGGRLKLRVEEDFKAVAAALSNVGCKNLEEFRKKAVLQLLSPIAIQEKYPQVEYKNG